MTCVILTTTTDPNRPYVTYKIEFEDDEKLTEWLDFKTILEEYYRIWGTEDTTGTNTAMTIFRRDGRIEQRVLKLTWPDVAVILSVADDIRRDVQRVGSGRIAKRVLIATTSKERREGKPGTY